MKPTDAVIAVTWRCNARCAMCGIWKQATCPELSPEVFRKLPHSLRDINLTGGEPFLRDDLPAVHTACLEAAPDARTIISTNGLLTDRIVAFTREMSRNEPGLGVAVSLDGPAPVHDELRGVKGAYERALGTVHALLDAGFRNIRIAFTATARNLQHMQATYQLSSKLGMEFTCAIEHASRHYFHSSGKPSPLPAETLRAQLLPIIRAELRSFSPRRWGRAYFMRGLYDFAARGRRPLPCRAGRDHFFMDPTGDIFTCNAAPFLMGSLNEADFAEVWSSPEARTARRRAASCRHGCWMVCTARTAIRAAWPRALGWALATRVFGLSPLGRRS